MTDGLKMGKGNILIADDEHINRRILSEMLSKLGYTVFATQDGEECLDVFMQKYDSIDLVILDVLMPVKNGLETYNELQDFDNRPKVILMSGVDLEGELAEAVDDEFTFYMQKPVKLHELSDLVANVLGLKYC